MTPNIEVKAEGSYRAKSPMVFTAFALFWVCADDYGFAFEGGVFAFLNGGVEVVHV